MATPPLLKRLNEETVLDTIRSGAPISRAEIARRAGISKPTVSLALRTLLEAGLVREAADGPPGPTYGALYFEPVAEAALVLGIDLGARFLRGAVSDLTGEIRARHDVERAGADADSALAAIVELRDSLARAAGLATGLIDQVVVGVPGVVEERTGAVSLAMNVPGLDGTGLGAGLVLRGELQRGHHGAAGELDYVAVGLEQDVDPCATALAGVAERLAQDATTTLAPPFDARSVFAAARSGDSVAREVVREEARRIALHIAPIAAVTDVGLVVLGGGIGANAQLLDDVRPLLAKWLPYPPRVEISSLGDGAVLMGALTVGLESALDRVFVSRRSPA